MKKSTLTLAVVAIVILLAFGTCRYLGAAHSAIETIARHLPSRLDRSHVLREEMKSQQSGIERSKAAAPDPSSYVATASQAEA